MHKAELLARLEFYRDLGFDSIYRLPPSAPTPGAPLDETRAVLPEPALSPQAAWRSSKEETNSTDLPRSAEPVWGVVPDSTLSGSVVRELVETPEPAVAALPPLEPVNDTLDRILLDLGDCKRCRLCLGRKKIVFGSGNSAAKLVFVGEGPGADEDEQGLPFVGRAGQLLTQMIDNTAARENIPIQREDVYICNVVKCRPPDNRTPQPDEMATCGEFLYRQLMTIKPRAICALGSTAMKALLNNREGITKTRGQWHKWNNIPVMVSYHPSYLLRQYNQQAKREAWEDLKAVLHFVYDPA